MSADQTQPATPSALTTEDVRHARIIAAWLTALSVNSNGGCGVSLRSAKPAACAFPKVARAFEAAQSAIQWHYTSLPFEIARRMSCIPTLDAWANKREAACNPPLVSVERAHALLSLINAEKERYAMHANGYSNASAAAVLRQLSKDVESRE